jgi:hypothetical protein
VTGWHLLSGKAQGGSDAKRIVTDAATPPGGKGQPAAVRSAGEGGWGPFDAACGVAQDRL